MKYTFRIKTATSPKGFNVVIDANSRKEAECEISWQYRWSKDQKLIKAE